MFSALRNNLECLFGNFGIIWNIYMALLIASFSLPLWAEEASILETNVEGSQKAFFESQIEIYNQTVTEEYKGLVQIRLELSILNGQHIMQLQGRARS